MTAETLLRRGDPASVLRTPAELRPDEGAVLYEPVVAAEPLDLVLLGVGPDGHTASLFAGYVALDAMTVMVGVRGAPKPPPERVMLMLRVLRGASRVVVLARCPRECARSTRRAPRGRRVLARRALPRADIGAEAPRVRARARRVPHRVVRLRSAARTGGDPVRGRRRRGARSPRTCGCRVASRTRARRAMGGIDAFKEDRRGDAYLALGLATLAIDMPGTGESPMSGDAGDPERLWDAIFDWAASRGEIDGARIAVVGGSTGGYWDSSCASAQRPDARGRHARRARAPRLHRGMDPTVAARRIPVRASNCRPAAYSSGLTKPPVVSQDCGQDWVGPGAVHGHSPPPHNAQMGSARTRSERTNARGPV